MNIQTPGGMQLRVRLRGHGNPGLLLIHGFGDGGFVWDTLLRHLGPHTSAALDLRGHGDSQWDPLQRYAVGDHVRDASEVFETLELDDVVLIGHSLGAEVALELTTRFPRRVRGLALVDWSPDPNPRSLTHVQQQFSRQRWQYDSAVEYAAVLAERLPFAQRSTLSAYAAAALRVAAAGMLELKCDPSLSLPVPDLDSGVARARLASLTCAVLLVRGAASGVLPERVARRVAAETPHCRLAVVENAGHAIPLDNPGGLSRAIGEFLTRLDVLPLAAPVPCLAASATLA